MACIHSSLDALSQFDRRLSDDAGTRWFFFREPDGVLFSVASADRAASVPQRTPLPARPRELPPRIARPIGLRAAA